MNARVYTLQDYALRQPASLYETLCLTAETAECLHGDGRMVQIGGDRLSPADIIRHTDGRLSLRSTNWSNNYSVKTLAVLLAELLLERRVMVLSLSAAERPSEVNALLAELDHKLRERAPAAWREALLVHLHAALLPEDEELPGFWSFYRGCLRLAASAPSAAPVAPVSRLRATMSAIGSFFGASA